MSKNKRIKAKVLISIIGISLILSAQYLNSTWDSRVKENFNDCDAIKNSSANNWNEDWVDWDLSSDDTDTISSVLSENFSSQLQEGHYPATYCFKNQNDINTFLNATGTIVGYPLYTEIMDNHRGILACKTNSSSAFRNGNTFLDQYISISYIEFWLGTSDKSIAQSLFVTHNGNNLGGANLLLAVRITSNKIQISYGDGAGGTIGEYVLDPMNDNQLYHIKLKIDLDNDKWSIWINNILKKDNVNFCSDNKFNYFNSFIISQISAVDCITYLDAIGYSWSDIDDSRFTFVQFSDMELRSGGIVDSRGRTSRERAVALINYLNLNEMFNFAINVGDINILDGQFIDVWEFYNESVKQRANFEIFEVRGNHDGSYDSTNFKTYTTRDIQYLFTYNGITFAFIGGWEYPFKEVGGCGVSFSPEQEDWILGLSEYEKVWAVCHFPIDGRNGNYWNDTALFNEFIENTNLIGYSAGHEDDIRYARETQYGFPEINGYGVHPMPERYQDIYYEKITITKHSIRDELINVDTGLVEDTIEFNINVDTGLVEDTIEFNKGYKIGDNFYYENYMGETFENYDIASNLTSLSGFTLTPATGCSININGTYDAHKKNIELFDNNIISWTAIGKVFTTQTTGTVEFWVKTTDSLKATHYYLGNSGNIGIHLLIQMGKLKYHNGDSTLELADISNDEWYHIRIDFDCNGGVNSFFSLYLDGINKGTNLNFRYDKSNVTYFMVCTSWDHSDYYTYLDSLSFSWENPIGLNLLKEMPEIYNPYSYISKDINHSFLNQYDDDPNYKYFYNITISFNYKFTQWGDYFSTTKINKTNLIDDNAWHFYSYTFIFDSSYTDYFSLNFNISNGQLVFTDFKYNAVLYTQNNIQQTSGSGDDDKNTSSSKGDTTLLWIPTIAIIGVTISLTVLGVKYLLKKKRNFK
ncbi:MAG: LamG-like jellyroll fold domain-containing protein [Promethearchaeota archaeon]